MLSEVRQLDAFLHMVAPGPIRLKRVADRLDVDEGALFRLLSLYEVEGIAEQQSALICPGCDAVVEKSDEEDDNDEHYYCDLCDRYMDAGLLRVETVYYVTASADINRTESSVHPNETESKKRVSYITASDFQLTRTSPWAALPVRDFIVESNTLGDIESGRILENVERYGIALFRMAGQSADEELIKAMGRLI